MGIIVQMKWLFKLSARRDLGLETLSKHGQLEDFYPKRGAERPHS